MKYMALTTTNAGAPVSLRLALDSFTRRIFRVFFFGGTNCHKFENIKHEKTITNKGLFLH